MAASVSELNFPQVVLDGCVGQTPYVRYWAAQALAKALIASPLSEWQRDLSAAYTIVAALALMWEDATEVSLKADIGAILHRVLRVFPRASFLDHPRREADINSIRNGVESAFATSDLTRDIVKALDAWSAPKADGLTCHRS